MTATTDTRRRERLAEPTDIAGAVERLTVLLDRLPEAYVTCTVYVADLRTLLDALQPKAGDCENCGGSGWYMQHDHRNAWFESCDVCNKDGSTPLIRYQEAAQSPHPNDWQDISTAPRDRPILLRVEDVAVQGEWAGPSDGAIYAKTSSVYNWFCRPTERTEHDSAVTAWAELPTPPGAEKGGLG